MADAVRAPEPEPVVREVRQGAVRAARRQVRERAVEDVHRDRDVQRAHGVEPVLTSTSETFVKLHTIEQTQLQGDFHTAKTNRAE